MKTEEENDQQDELLPEDRADGDNDRSEDTSNSDAAADNARETERIFEAARSTAPPRTLENEDPERITDDRDPRENVAGDDADRKIQQDDVRENELDDVDGISDADRDALTGSTNLPLSDLKKENSPGENEE
ncbi:MAG: hypothetical protein INR69_11915 [Mucilaginibacter polytrichastri]|nr:hypothetical protein [Mucilaginibacter polytrichastri]